MNNKEELKERFPKMYADVVAGVYHPAGWNELVAELSAVLNTVCPKIRVIQTKEKFATLRFYVSNASALAMNVIEMYEFKSGFVCEDCGKPGRLYETTFGHRIHTLCCKCARQRGLKRVR